MRVLVSDTSVLVDLERGALLPQAFRVPDAFAVPDVLFESELRNFGGSELLRLGLRVESLDGDGVALAQGFRRARPALTVADSFALALARMNGWVLLTGDGVLRTLADAENVECHGLLWLLDQIEAARIASLEELGRALAIIRAHPKCRLPLAEVELRLRRYAVGRGG